MFSLLRPSCDFFDGFLQQTGAKTLIESAEIVGRSCGHRAVFAAVHRNHIDVADALAALIRRLCGDRTIAVMCDPRVLLEICVINVYN